MGKMRTIKHETQESAVGTLSGDCRRAFAAGKWLAAIWCVKDGEDGGVELVGRTTWDFPPEGFGECIDSLRENLERESQGPVLPKGPLPFAEFLKGQIDMLKAEDNKMPEVEEELDRARALADARESREGIGPVTGEEVPKE